MDRRIMGIETEFGIMHTRPTGAVLSPDDAARKLFQPIVHWGRSSNVFLPNGARLYLDVGSHPEYATAECATIEDAVAHDRAGEIIVDTMRKKLEESLAQDGTGGSIYLFKNNVDSAGNSYGSHENYMIARSTRFSRLVAHLIPFLVTRQLLTGAGKVHPTGPTAYGHHHLTSSPGQASYSFSQRADHVWEESSSATTRSRPLINTRDEPHGDAKRFRRLHVIVGDSTMSTTTTAMRLATTDLMLRMIEAGNALKDRTLKDPSLALRHISHDLTGTVTVELADGSTRSALDLQYEYLEEITRFIQAHGQHHDQIPWVLDLWERTLDAIERKDYSGIDTEIDWAIKKKLLDTWAHHNKSDYSAPKIAHMDLAYHDLADGRGLFRILEARGMAARLPGTDGSEAHTAVTTPPQTRAYIRGALIKAATHAGYNPTVDWVNMKINGAPQRTLTLKDPFSTQDDSADVLLTQLQQEAAQTSGHPPLLPYV